MRALAVIRLERHAERRDFFTERLQAVLREAERPRRRRVEPDVTTREWRLEQPCAQRATRKVQARSLRVPAPRFSRCERRQWRRRRQLDAQRETLARARERNAMAVDDDGVATREARSKRERETKNNREAFSKDGRVDSRLGRHASQSNRQTRGARARIYRVDRYTDTHTQAHIHTYTDRRGDLRTHADVPTESRHEAEERT